MVPFFFVNFIFLCKAEYTYYEAMLNYTLQQSGLKVHDFYWSDYWFEFMSFLWALTSIHTYTYIAHQIQISNVFLDCWCYCSWKYYNDLTYFVVVIVIIIIIIIFIIILIEDTYYYHYPLSFINLFFIFAAEWQFQKISSSFTPGDFRQVAPRTRRKEVSSISAEDPEERDDSEADKQVFLCPKEGCTRAFQRHSSLEKHIAFGTCSKAIERETLLDLAKLKYAAILQEGESSLPTITATNSSAT